MNVYSQITHTKHTRTHILATMFTTKEKDQSLIISPVYELCYTLHVFYLRMPM